MARRPRACTSFDDRPGRRLRRGGVVLRPRQAARDRPPGSIRRSPFSAQAETLPRRRPAPRHMARRRARAFLAGCLRRGWACWLMLRADTATPASSLSPAWCRPRLRAAAAPRPRWRNALAAMNAPGRRRGRRRHAAAAAGAGRRRVDASACSRRRSSSKPAPRTASVRRSREVGTRLDRDDGRAPGRPHALHRRRERDGHLIGFVELRFGDAPAAAVRPGGRSRTPVRPRALCRARSGHAVARACRYAGGDGRGRAVWLTVWSATRARWPSTAPRLRRGGRCQYRFQNETYENRRFARVAHCAAARRRCGPATPHQSPITSSTRRKVATPRPSAMRLPGSGAAPRSTPPLRGAAPGAWLYVMVGAQGSGKSRWRAARLQERSAIVFDAIPVQRFERAPLLATAARHGVTASPSGAARRSRPPGAKRGRPADEVADAQGLRNVRRAAAPQATRASGRHRRRR